MKEWKFIMKYLLKLANSFQHKTTNNFLTIILKYGLQPYLHITTCMKRKRKQLWFVNKEFLV